MLRVKKSYSKNDEPPTTIRTGDTVLIKFARQRK